MGNIYDENIFLFSEESYLSKILAEQGTKAYYCNDIKVLHKEDGSVKFRTDIDEQLRKASVYVYEKYYHFS